LADHPCPSARTTAAELATARLDRDDLESALRLIWPYTAKLYAGFTCPSADKRPATTRCSMN